MLVCPVKVYCYLLLGRSSKKKKICFRSGIEGRRSSYCKKGLNNMMTTVTDVFLFSPFKNNGRRWVDR
jgi:hypothetical protein